MCVCMIYFLCTLLLLCIFFLFKQKTAYEMRISDWSSDVCSSDLSGRSLSFMAPPHRSRHCGDNRRQPHAAPTLTWVLPRGFTRSLMAARTSAFLLVSEIGRASCRERVCK